MWWWFLDSSRGDCVMSCWLTNCLRSGGVTSEEMNGTGEAAYIAAFKLHVTGVLHLQRDMFFKR